jgi:uncharacterized membrane protein YhaH (DUF805 family)
MQKPTYRLTRQAFWASFWLSWGIIVALVAGGLSGLPQAEPIAAIALPSLVLLIAAMLGIHRFAGSADMRTLAEAGAGAEPMREDEP